MIWTMKWNHQPASYNSPTLSLCLIQLILALSGVSSSGTFTVSGPVIQPILAFVGKDVHLPCHLSPKMDAQGMTVKWVRGPLVVHIYRMGQEIKEVQAPAFQGRTEMLREDMAEGKVTMIIHRVQLSDAGLYTCYFQRGTFYNETSFDLQVAECQKGIFSVICPAQLIQAKQGEDVRLSCEVSPKMDARDMAVNWFRNQTLVLRYPTGEKLEESQGAELQGRTELLKQDMAEGKVTLRIQQVLVSDSGPYTCCVLSHDNCDEAQLELQVADNLPTSQKTFTMIVSIVLVFIGFLFVIYFFWERKLQRTRAEVLQRHQFQEEDREAAGTNRDSPASPEDLHLSPGLPAKDSVSPLVIQEGEGGTS
ncbi:myelin-oligodendrocyte glycoprotein-like [Trichosurus vulpecula]|uniref:myelin-oligodendrocyte glycoprotein-like n=1 Tax=Trichosurus vulpecula TaxID=9337 RepID=UPI00186B0EBD|nr:myelin-oligodendrocyte glycoprotein-like [Trichosurus vulpecula]